MNSKIEYVVGDATRPLHTEQGIHYILQVVNNMGGYGAGFSGAVSRRWPIVAKKYREWSHDENTFVLGNIQEVQVEHNISVINIIGQHGVIGMFEDDVPIRYESLRNGLEKTAILANPLNAILHMPRIGCGLAGGKWSKVEPLIQEECIDKRNLRVIVYDFD